MHRIAFSRTTLILVVAGVMFVGLASCGGGGDGGGGRNGTIVMPPGNRAPVAGRRIADISTNTAVSAHVLANLDGDFGYFSDLDGDRLTFTATSSNGNVAAYRFLPGYYDDVPNGTGMGMEVLIRGPGTATITVTARDPGGLTARQQFRVSVSQTTSRNRAPTIRSRIPSIELRVGGSWTFNNTSSRFSDPDGDRLTITAQPVGVNSSYVTATLSGEQLVIRAVRELPSDVIFLETSVRVMARDPGGLTASQTFTVRVLPSLSRNRAPTIRSRIPSIELRVGGSWTFNNTSSRFSDPDGDRLTITAQPVGVNSSYVTATLSGEQLVIRAVRELPSDVIFLETSVRVTARDPGGLTASQTFTVTVRASRTQPPSRPTAVFRISDACNDGSAIQYRFFQYDRWRSGNTVDGESASGVWPSSTRVYTTQGLGQTGEHRLNCTAGKGVCFGGNRRNNPSAGYWGAGIDGDKRCSRCCVRCPASGTATFSGGRLTC